MWHKKGRTRLESLVITICNNSQCLFRHTCHESFLSLTLFLKQLKLKSDYHSSAITKTFWLLFVVLQFHRNKTRVCSVHVTCTARCF